MGRPTKYEARYCEEVNLHMADGASLTSFAAEIDVARSTINEWMSAHPEFSEACARAKAKSAAWWEKVNRSLAMTGEGNAGACRLGLLNMAGDDWRDKTLVGSDPENPITPGFIVLGAGPDVPNSAS